MVATPYLFFDEYVSLMTFLREIIMGWLWLVGSLKL